MNCRARTYANMNQETKFTKRCTFAFETMRSISFINAALVRYCPESTRFKTVAISMGSSSDTGK